MTTVVRGLKELKELLSDKQAWIKMSSARDKNGDSIHATSENAVCWCITGGIYRVAGSGKSELYEAMCKAIKKQIRKSHSDSIDGPIIEYNDNPNIKHYHVMNMLEKTIKNESDLLMVRK